MNGYVFPSVTGQASASALQSAVDAQLGLPKAGVNVGGGIHVTPLFVTLTYAQPIQNKSSLQWAYLADPTTQAALAAAAVAAPAPVALDATWTPIAGASVGQVSA